MAIANNSTPIGQSSLGQALPAQSSPDQAVQLQLHDIHVPEQVTNFPIAPGWWLLLALILIAAFWSFKKFKQKKRLNANKNQALAVLASNQTLSAKECISLLKCTAMQYFSRQQLAKLYGDNFQGFLMQQLPQKYQVNFIELSTPAFQGQYQAQQEPNADIDLACRQAAKLWLTYALPIDKNQAANKTELVNKTKELSA
ncbi:MAG: DUF4381 domain-containing protein [Colwellia sp.]|nr:DUF4381 domain-containing protein [Colwellia sp.]